MGIKEKIYISQLDRKITFAKKVAVQSTTGASKDRFQPITSVWAMQEPIKSTEIWEDKPVIVNGFRYTIRYQKALLEMSLQELVILDEDQRYEITGVTHVGRKQYIKLEAYVES